MVRKHVLDSILQKKNNFDAHMDDAQLFIFLLIVVLDVFLILLNLFNKSAITTMNYLLLMTSKLVRENGDVSLEEKLDVVVNCRLNLNFTHHHKQHGQNHVKY